MPNELNNNALGGGSLLLRRRAMMMKKAGTPGPAANEIWYKTTNGNVSQIYQYANPMPISNEVVGDKCVLTYANDLTVITASPFNSYNGGLGQTITEIILPDTLVDITPFSWQKALCIQLTGLQRIHLPSALATLPSYTFFLASGLQIIKIPQSVTWMGYVSLATNYTGGTEVIMESAIPPTLEKADVFLYAPPVIYVPDNAVNAYKAAQYWSAHASKIHPISEKTTPIQPL